MSGLTLKQANAIVEGALAKAHEMTIKPLAVVVIKDAAGNILGAAGASGGTGDEDEACCAAGIEKAGLKADVSA